MRWPLFYEQEDAWLAALAAYRRLRQATKD